MFLNKRLFRIRKAGQLTGIVPTTRRTESNWSDVDPYLFASEIAWSQMAEFSGASLDDIICNPSLASRFDEIAKRFAPGYSPLQYRLAALRLRKEAKGIDSRAKQIQTIRWQIEPGIELDSIRAEKQDSEAGLYLVRSNGLPLYVGESLNLKRWVESQFDHGNQGQEWKSMGQSLTLATIPYRKLSGCNLDLKPDPMAKWLMAYQLQLVRKFTAGRDHHAPPLNRLGRSDSKEQVS
jgi:hypothetical protein